MTPRQAFAFLQPCARAWETTRRGFAEFVAYKGERWSTILTVNK